MWCGLLLKRGARRKGERGAQLRLAVPLLLLLLLPCPVPRTLRRHPLAPVGWALAALVALLLRSVVAAGDAATRALLPRLT